MQAKRAIASARAFLGVPFDLLVDVTGIEHKGDWHFWEDPEGNRLRIGKNKVVQVYPAKQENGLTKDVFRKARPERIAQQSYWVLAVFGEHKTLLNFLGHDGLLRCCYFEDNVWQYNISPVLLGYQVLRYVFTGYTDIDTRQIDTLKLSYPKCFEIEEAWASGFPSENSKLQERILCHLKNQESLE